jgi:hypothetical protein
MAAMRMIVTHQATAGAAAPGAAHQRAIAIREESQAKPNNWQHDTMRAER